MSQLSQAKFSQYAGPSRAAVRAYLGNKAASKIQKFVRARGKDKKVTGGYVRGSRGNTRAIKLYNSAGSGVVFPDRVEVNCVTTLCGYIAAASNRSTTGNYMSVMVNSIASPFSTTYSFTTTTASYTYAFSGTLAQGYAITNNPMMFGDISTLYSKYVVVGYKIEVTVNPSSTGDPLRMTLGAYGTEQIPSSAAGNVNLRVLEAQPYTLSKTCANAVIGGPGVNNTLVLSGAPYKDMGYTREQYMDNLTAVTNQPTLSDYVGLFLQPLNGTSNSSPVNVSIKLSQIVLLSDLVQPTT